VKHGFASFNSEQVNITSNIPYEQWHTDRLSDVKALERRIDEIMTFIVNGYILTVHTEYFDVESYGHPMTNQTYEEYDLRNIPWIPRPSTSNTQSEQEISEAANHESSQSLDRVSPIQPPSASTSDETEDDTTSGRGSNNASLTHSTSTSTSQEEDSEG